MLRWLYSLLLFGGYHSSEEFNYVPNVEKEPIERSLVVVIPSYNNGDFVEKNLESVFSQQYKNFRVLYTNDASTDGTGRYVEKYIKDNNLSEQLTLVTNEQNMGAAYNLYQMIHSCKSHEIICILDGDDQFRHDRVLDRINKAYTNEDAWMVYAQYSNRFTAAGDTVPIKKEMLEEGRHRELPWKTFGFRTFYAGLYQSIPLEKWLYNGRHYPVSNDVILMLYLIDRAREHVLFIPESLYFYNVDNPINDFKIRVEEQRAMKKYMWSLPPLDRLYSKEDFLE